jgi:hypothetical protein
VTEPDGDAASRLSAALEKILQGREPGDAGDASAAAAESPDGAVPTDATYVLPEIVPATIDLPISPQLSARPPDATVPRPPQPAVVPRPPQVAPALAPAAPSPVPATAWGDHVPTPSARPAASLRAPGRRPRVRRVTRVVRHVDPWSVFKVALVFSFVGYLVVLTSGVLLWRVADSTGTLDNVERWFTQFGWETFEFKGGEVFSNAWVIGLFVAVGTTGAAVLVATLFNLVSDIVGGIRVTVLEEEVVERTAASTRRYVVRRPPIADAAIGGSTQWNVDDDEPLPASRPAANTAGAPSAPAPVAGWSVDDDPPT